MSEALSRARNLVFAIIGWQTMLYKPDIGSCSRAQLAIVDETDGYRGHAYMHLRQDQSASRKALHEFLMGFGVLLPCYNFSALASDDDKRALITTKTVSPESLNAHLLNSAGGIYIKWTDSPACHLEFDASSSTLYLFRFPTLCAINLLSQEDRPSQHLILVQHYLLLHRTRQSIRMSMTYFEKPYSLIACYSDRTRRRGGYFAG